MSEKKVKRIAFAADVQELATAQRMFDLVKLVMRAGVPASGAPQVIACIYNHPVIGPQVPVLRRARAEGLTTDQLSERVDACTRDAGLIQAGATHGEWDDEGTRAHGKQLAANARRQFAELGDKDKPFVRDFFATEQVKLEITVPGKLVECLLKGHEHARDTMHMLSTIALGNRLQEYVNARRCTEPPPAPVAEPKKTDPSLN